jgi:hypothetical protein
MQILVSQIELVLSSAGKNSAFLGWIETAIITRDNVILINQ